MNVYGLALENSFVSECAVDKPEIVKRNLAGNFGQSNPIKFPYKNFSHSLN